MDEKVQKLLAEIRHKVVFDRVEPLTKGYSNARKYILYESDRPIYLLRVYELDSYSRRTEEYTYLNLHYNNGVCCQKPVCIDALYDLKLCYLLLPYMEGTSGDEMLRNLPTEDQYMQGLMAGEQLRKIHMVVPDTPINWFERRYTKYVQKKMKVMELDIDFYKQGYIESYIEQNFDLLRDSPVCFQHDDFHPSNLIFNTNILVGVIDFSRFDWGDPWEEFFKLPKYTCRISNPFAYGQVHGYFNGSIPDLFWKKYNLFVALNQHATLIGGYQGRKTGEMLEKIRSTIETHDFACGGPPKWFLESESKNEGE